MWKPEHRRAANRCGLRYPGDLTDCEWALVDPLIPPAKRGGRRRTIDVREERTFAWISNCRRLAKDFERHARKAAAFIRLAMIRIMLRRIAANPST